MHAVPNRKGEYVYEEGYVRELCTQCTKSSETKIQAESRVSDGYLDDQAEASKVRRRVGGHRH